MSLKQLYSTPLLKSDNVIKTKHIFCKNEPSCTNVIKNYKYNNLNNNSYKYMYYYKYNNSYMYNGIKK